MIKPSVVLTVIWTIGEEQPPSVSYTQGYEELPTIFRTFRIGNEVRHFARISREKRTTVDNPVGFFCTARRAAKTEKWLNQL